jgi:hypothetical protein
MHTPFQRLLDRIADLALGPAAKIGEPTRANPGISCVPPQRLGSSALCGSSRAPRR